MNKYKIIIPLNIIYINIFSSYSNIYVLCIICVYYYMVINSIFIFISIFIT